MRGVALVAVAMACGRIGYDYPTNDGGDSSSTACSIAFDTASTAAGNTNTLMWTHATAGADRRLVVGVSVRPSLNVRVSTITYAGVTLTLIGAKSLGVSIRVELWELVAPPTGENTVRVTLTGAQDAVAGALSLTGTMQTAATASAFTTGTGTATSVSVDATANSWLVDIAAYRMGGVAIPASPQRSRWESPTGQAVEADGSTSGPLSASTVSMAWTLPTMSEWAAGAVVIAPSCP